MKKPNTGYKKPKKYKKKKEHYIGKLLVANPRKVSFNEKLVKFLIYFALRLVIKPSKWKNPEKNYEIIDRTYKRIMSSDFIYIPSSIAFYLIMAFMPILSLIMFLYQFDVIQSWLSEGHWTYSATAVPHAGTGLTPIESPVFLDEKGYNEWFSHLDPKNYTLHPDTKEWVVEKNLLSEILGKFIPGMKQIINDMTHVSSGNTSSSIVNAGAFTATVLSLVASTWIAAGGFAKLVFTQSYMYEHKFVGGYWMNKFKGMILVTLFTLFLFTALVVNISYGKYVSSLEIDSRLKTGLNMGFLIIGLFFGIFFGFIALFKFSPRFKIRLKHIIPGAMVSTIPTTLFLSLFGYISSLWSYGNYGIIGTIMYLGMGSLLITYFIFVGLSANVAYYKTFVGKKVQTKWTISNK